MSGINPSLPNCISPSPLAMVICDAIWVDPGNQKHFLLGTFNEIYATNFPVIHPNMAVYIEASGGRGQMTITIRGIDADDTVEIFRVEGEADFADPRTVMQMGINVPPIAFPRAGEYRIQFYANEEFMVERRILVRTPRTGPIEENQ